MGDTIKLAYDVFKIYSKDFYDDLLNYDFAILTAIVTVGVSLLIVLIYYYVIDRPATGKLKIWILFLLGNALILAIVAYNIANNTIVDAYAAANQNTPDYSNDLLYFALTNACFSTVLFFFMSLPAKLKSTNSSHIPF